MSDAFTAASELMRRFQRMPTVRSVRYHEQQPAQAFFAIELSQGNADARRLIIELLNDFHYQFVDSVSIDFRITECGSVEVA